jgi:hypothetical protein
MNARYRRLIANGKKTPVATTAIARAVAGRLRSDQTRGTAFRGDGSENVIVDPDLRRKWRRAVLGLLPRQEGLDDARAAAAAWATMLCRLQLFGFCGGGVDGVGPSSDEWREITSDERPRKFSNR